VLTHKIPNKAPDKAAIISLYFRKKIGDDSQNGVVFMLDTLLPASRSKATNNMFDGFDGRSAEARRFRDLMLAYADDAGGAAVLTEAQRALVKQAATLTLQSERLQSAMLAGGAVDVDQQTRVANSLARTLSRLGRNRAAP
jgi:hypothetical protein